ncbi:MAG: sialate O-acetylesterase [Rikenellaceae bacterium]
MKNFLLSVLGLSIIATSCTVNPTQQQSQDEELQIYLCIGQSNMEGSADIEAQDTTVSDRLLMMPTMQWKDSTRILGEWTVGLPPQSNENGGLSICDYFGRTMVDSLPENVKVGLVTVAVGGCDMRMFDKTIYKDYLATYNEPWFLNKVENYGGYPYQRLVDVARVAQKDGTIKGIILHQGETNTGDSLWCNYVKSVYDSLLVDLNLCAQDVPLIAGQVVPESADGVCAPMNGIIDLLPETIPTARVVSSEGLGVRTDNVHFNSQGVREFGRRYASAMLEAQR